MPRPYLALVPVALAAAIAASSACSSPREPDTRLIPPALPIAAAQEAAKPIVAVAPAPEPDRAPSAEDVKEFERAVLK